MVEEIRSVTAEEVELKGPEVGETVERESAFRAAPKMNKSPLHGLWALTNRDLGKWYRNPILLFMSLIQPVIWLALFGKALNFGAFISNTGSINAAAIMQATFGTSSYFSFLVAGMLAFVILFTTAFGGMSVVFDRRFGFLNKALSTPVGRGAVVTAKVLQSVIRSLILSGIVLLIGVILGMDTSSFSVLGMLGTFGAMFLIAFGLSSLFVMLALRSSDWQTQMAIINLLNLPLLFASNALLPLTIMPNWLQYVAKFNPVSYANDAARQLLLGASGSSVLASLPVDFAVLVGFAVFFAGIGIVLSWKFLSK